MEKKIIAAAAAVIFAGAMLTAGKYIKDSGIFRDYPDAEYLTTEEAEHRPIYNQLDKDEKAIYTALYRGISQKEEKIPLPMDISGDEYSKIYCILEKQEGSFFYLDSVYYTAMKVRDAKIAYREKSGINIKSSELGAAVDTALKSAADYWSDYEKVRYINDYIVEKCHYVSGDDSEYASTVYGCLVEGKANCEGYAKTFRLLASELGVNSVVVTGQTDKGENHAWNQVEVGGEWFNIDVTWADTDHDGEISQMYFLCSDEDFSKTHISDNTLFEPYKCGSNDKNYYAQLGLYAESVDDALDIVRRELNEGNGIIDLKFADENSYNEFKDVYITHQKIFDIVEETSYPYAQMSSLCCKDNEREHCITLDFTK